MERKIVVKADVIAALQEVGLTAGQTVIVHTSLSSLGFVCGGAQLIIEVLLDSITPQGTLIMPTQSWKNLDPQTGVHWQEPEAWYQIIRDNWPAYSKHLTPTNTMGAVAELFRTYPGTVRSDHPARSLAAWGKHAAYLTENHDLSNIFGNNSPIGKLYELDGFVLLLGVGYDKNTSLHLADFRASYPNKHTTTESSAMLVDGERQWVSYTTLAVDGNDFADIGSAFEKTASVSKATLGNGLIRFMKQRTLVDFAVNWIEQNRR